MKNDKVTSHVPDPDEMTPADLIAIAALLDSLGSADRDSMPVGMAERIAATSAGAMLHPDAADSAEEIAAIARTVEVERELVPAGLEQRVFEASRGELAGGTKLKLSGEGKLPSRVTVRPAWWRGGVARLAAAMAIVSAGVLVFVSLRQGGEALESTGTDVKVLSASFDSEMAEFFDLLESAPGTGATETGMLNDHSITDQLLEWESL